MRLFLITLILTGSLIATDFSARYNVDVGMFGKVGYADLTFNETRDRYEMKLVAKTTGTAATLTGERMETYISKGSVVSGRYLPDTFIKIKKTTSMERVQTYHFDHIKQEITLKEDKTEWVSGSEFDPIAFKIVKQNLQQSSSMSSVLQTYNENDILSSYLNTKQRCNAEKKEYDLHAVGAHNDEKEITLSFLDGLKRTQAASSFSKDTGNIYNLHVQALDKEDTTVDVLIAFDNDGHMKEAVLDDLFWVGEIKAKREYHRVTQR